ncbi:MAG: FecR domain-containing protein [Bryobacteraceae bacterium]
MPEDRLDSLLSEMRNQDVASEEVAAAKERVWQKLAAATSSVCPEFQVDLVEYAAGRLEGSRRLLLEDHLGRCPACRRTLAEGRGKLRPMPLPIARRRTLPAWTRWTVAAGLAAAALYLGRGPIDKALAPSGPRATVERATGPLYRLPQGMLAPGAPLAEGEVVRTGLGTRAVLRLRDGSLVEVNERTELSVEAAWSGQSIRLERGDVIVQAAKQRRGRLRVITRDSEASVKGTIFGVSAGLTGTLVSVVEGSVQVTQPAGQRLLTRGQRAASTRALERVPVRRTLAWSENAQKYFEVLGELAKVEASVAATSTPAPRTQSKLLPYLPAGAFVYVALPNLGPALDQAVAMIEQRAAENAALREWWASAERQHFKDLVNRAHVLAPLIGEEVVFVVSRTAADTGTPLHAMLAEVQPGRQAALRQELDKLLSGTPAAASISEKLLVVSGSKAQLDSMLGRLGLGASSPFAAEIGSHYKEGVGVLFAFDAASALAGKTAPPAATVLGANKLKYLVFEQHPAAAGDELEASFTFDGPRTGVAGWLASPGVAGSAEYISTSAIASVSACTRSPREAFEELERLLAKVSPKFQQDLAEMETKTGVRVADDLAAALGTDFSFAIERPTVPVPGWVAAVQVNQPGVLDLAVHRLVDAVNREVDATSQSPRLTLEQQAADGRTWTILKNARLNTTLYWTLDRGYWIMSTDRSLAAQAISVRASGLPLVRSEQFRAQFPASSVVGQSGFFWFNPQGPLADIAGLLGGGQLQALLRSREPILAVVNGETERIHVASRTRLMSMLLTMMMAGTPGHATRQGDVASDAGN